MLAHHNNLTDFDTEITWLNDDMGGRAMTLTFRSTERGGSAGVYLHIVPDSMVLSVPVIPPGTVKSILNGFRVSIAERGAVQLLL